MTPQEVYALPVAYDGLLPCLADMGPGIVVCDPPASYSPRDPEENVLYGVVAAQLETFLVGPF